MWSRGPRTAEFAAVPICADFRRRRKHGLPGPQAALEASAPTASPQAALQEAWAIVRSAGGSGVEQSEQIHGNLNQVSLCNSDIAIHFSRFLFRPALRSASGNSGLPAVQAKQRRGVLQLQEAPQLSAPAPCRNAQLYPTAPKKISMAPENPEIDASLDTYGPFRCPQSLLQFLMQNLAIGYSVNLQRRLA